ncbi:Retrovirus-related Pol polyprotein from transposon TNT 1-94 [Eumeta japonica]|uniref:Retrovirus-related Pol polyprotein from transposon TNT 1-94 n=1 Tax=Eumeta variegata TaxID=151549 RepID=A0A4C1Z991_EUMVA|nr:Retrovirus-related Pol polyprotein from transposon TNT 1-94 [Eumeta japonica]
MGSAISWRSHKQQTIALSTAEAEYMSISSTAQEALWLQQLHAELGQQQRNPLVIFSDNQSAIKPSNNDCYLHIDIRYHFLKDHVNKLEINFCYVKGASQSACGRHGLNIPAIALLRQTADGCRSEQSHLGIETAYEEYCGDGVCDAAFEF